MTEADEQSEARLEEEAPSPGWRKVFGLPEGKILLAGIAATAIYFGCVGAAYFRDPDFGHALLSMTTTHVLGGRAAGLSYGYAQGLRPWLVIVANMGIETFLVLLFYPLFVFSYQHLIVVKPLEDTMRRAREAARSHQSTIVKLGVPGLLLFVWFPFYMTGPLVGCVIGFLIGLRPIVNLAVVLSGTYLAIFCWGVVLQRIHDRLASLGPYVPVVFVGFILLVAVSIHVRYAFLRRPRQAEGADQIGAGNGEERRPPS
jgi:uncharacterized membrane protein